MSNWLVAIIMFGVGAFFGLICMAVVACNTRVEAERQAYTEGYRDGHRNGLRWGKVLKIDAVLYEELKAKATGRVDVAPGNDSVRGSK
jgi:hypothetical protein